MKKIINPLLVVLLPLFLFSQNHKIDSLLFLIKKDKDDTSKVNHLNNLSREYLDIGSYDSSFAFANNALKLSQQLNPYYKKGIAFSYNNLGIIYKEQANYPKAMEYYLKGIKIDEELENKKGIAGKLINIGAIYGLNGDYPKALEYYFKGLNITEEMGYKKYQANALSNIGIVYAKQNDTPKALKYYFKALKLCEELGDKNGIAYRFVQIGSAYHRQKDYPKALDYYFKAMQQAEEFGDKILITSSLANIGEVYTKTKKYVEAEKYLSDAMKLAQELGAQDYKRQIEESFSNLYSKTNRLQLALEHYKKAMAIKDTLFNQDKNKEITRKEMNYEFEKKEAVTNAVYKKELENQQVIAEEKNRKQNMITWSVVVGLLLVVVFAGFIFRSLRITRKQKYIIELQKNEVSRQKELVEIHQKEIIDSITYAKRLQEAILPPTDYVKKHLPDSFILYKPKDIVAGDFYWMEVLNDIIFIAAADCTGHGVPGAMVSVVCSNALNRTVKEFGLRDTGKILDKVTELVLETFEKSDKDVKDGMDISLMSINNETKQIHWSGANNALWYIQNNEVIEITANKQPIGKHDNRKPFTTHSIVYQPNATFYLYTDGYADQFGGIKGKKFKYKQLEEKLLEISSNTLLEQQELLDKTFVEWKGKLEQVDDVCIIGIKLS